MASQLRMCAWKSPLVLEVRIQPSGNSTTWELILDLILSQFCFAAASLCAVLKVFSLFLVSSAEPGRAKSFQIVEMVPPAGKLPNLTARKATLLGP